MKMGFLDGDTLTSKAIRLCLNVSNEEERCWGLTNFETQCPEWRMGVGMIVGV